MFYEYILKLLSYKDCIVLKAQWRQSNQTLHNHKQPTVNQYYISDFDQQALDHSKQTDHLPPIKLPIKNKMSHKISRSLYQEPQDKKIERNILHYSIKRKKYNEKYLQEYLQNETKKNNAYSIEKPNGPDRKKQEIFSSAKIQKINKVKVAQLRPAMKSFKEEYKIRQESIQRFLTESNELQNYKMLSHLGKGCFSVVSLAVEKDTNKRFAIKTYAKIDQIQDYKFDNIYREINNLRLLKHSNIVNLFHVIKDKRKLLLIMEDGGKLSLAGLLRKNKAIPQNIARPIFKQLVEAVKYCHQNHICHRDLKLENILVDESHVVKVIDFGFSSKCGQKLSNYCGTPPYMAPQITLKAPYFGQPADMWALGIILYLMLVGKFPFRAPSEKQLYRLIQQGKFEMVEGLSPQAKDIIAKLLKCSTRDRSTAQQILTSSWLS